MTYDVIVCGGGIAGVSAALSASRNNARVLLIEREYALGGLATLGLIVIYLPICDGLGTQMISGISEELLKLSLKYGPGEIPAPWKNKDSKKEERKRDRYRVTYNAASFIIAMERELLKNNVEILYGSHISGVKTENGKVKSVFIETKTGKEEIKGKVFIDATGDADICYFAGENTVEDTTNRRTGWYFSYDEKDLQLNGLTDPLYTELPKGSREYSGTNMKDISTQCIDARKMILDDILEKQKQNKSIYPLIIPSFHGLRMTRRFNGSFSFKKEHEGIYFEDAIGMMGNWHYHIKERYSIPLRTIVCEKNNNLYVAGRCISSEGEGWDLTRVIPVCALTGEACGLIAAEQAKNNQIPDIKTIQQKLKESGNLINEDLFARRS